MTDPNLNTFAPFPKIARISRDMIITEKLDGTNAQVIIAESVLEGTSDPTVLAVVKRDGQLPLHIRAASRTRLITPEDDNFGFAAWVRDNSAELAKLGPGRHFGEWWGKGIQRGYGLTEKRFSLFNVGRWYNPEQWLPEEYHAKNCSLPPACCSVVPVLSYGPFDTSRINGVLETLGVIGSTAAPGFAKPEGIVIFHTHSGYLFKKTFEKDAEGKGQ